MNAVDFLTIRLTWAEETSLRPTPHLLRGAIAGHFPDNPLFHQHDGERTVYRYPHIHYRWDDEGPIILGIGEGAQFLTGVEWVGMQLRIGNAYVTVRDARCMFHRHVIQPATRLLRYEFASPWLPLSQDNYQRYRLLNAGEKTAERDRLAVAGMLVALRGLGMEFPGRLFAAFELHANRLCQYKDVELLGFRGCLLANVDLPDGFALGRAVSHGYGWLYRNSALPPDTAKCQ